MPLRAIFTESEERHAQVTQWSEPRLNRTGNSAYFEPISASHLSELLHINQGSSSNKVALEEVMAYYVKKFP